MFGWVSPATAIASRRNRSATTGSVARLGLSHLRATLRSSDEVGGQPHLGHPALGEPALEPVAAGEDDRSVTRSADARWSGGSGRTPAFRHAR